MIRDILDEVAALVCLILVGACIVTWCAVLAPT